MEGWSELDRQQRQLARCTADLKGPLPAHNPSFEHTGSSSKPGRPALQPHSPVTKRLRRRCGAASSRHASSTAAGTAARLLSRASRVSVEPLPPSAWSWAAGEGGAGRGQKR
jgi:hypothetical protein